MTQKFKVGEVVKLDESCRSALGTLNEQMDTAQAGYKLACEMVKNANKALFTALFQAHHEIDGYRIKYDHEAHEVTVLYGDCGEWKQ